MSKKPIVGVVIVSYGHEKFLPNLVKALRNQMNSDDKIVVVDNHPSRSSYDCVVNNKNVDFAIPSDNKGFAAGCNTGAEKILKLVDVLFFINPDTMPKQGVIDVVRSADYSYYAAIMTLLVLPDKTVNSAGNVVHISGLSWSDGFGSKISDYTKNQEISCLSGACMAISKKWWNKVKGIPESYFLYYEDTDFSSLIILMGGKLGLLPDAHVEHEYDFKKGTYKWLYIERNRPLYILRTWPLSVIIVLSIQLLFVGIGLWFVALLQKRLKLKFKSLIMTIKALPETLKARHQIQKTKVISGYEFLSKLSYKLDTPMLGKLGNNWAINIIYMVYYKICLAILRLFTI